MWFITNTSLLMTGNHIAWSTLCLYFIKHVKSFTIKAQILSSGISI